MNEQKIQFLRELAERLSDIHAAAPIRPSSMTAAKMVRGVLSKFDIVDEVSVVTRKLKDGQSHTFVKVHECVIDVTNDIAPFSATEDEYPLTSQMKGRGRDPKAIDVDGDGNAELTITTFIQALLTSPKTPSGRFREDAQQFNIKLKDIRYQLKRLGVAAKYDTIRAFIDQHLSDELEFDEVQKLQCVILKTGMTTGQWNEERHTVTELIDTMFNKYVKKMQATG